MNWNIADAKQKFSELIQAAENEPQWIYNRDRLVAAVVPAEALQEFLAWRGEREPFPGRGLRRAAPDLPGRGLHLRNSAAAGAAEPLPRCSRRPFCVTRTSSASW